ncbi:MAG: copper homeostasis protein CutC [Planctomycetes bacterium]|nr:copper homeostasis protein CutC [Planctomycetota bacterium]
MALLEVCVDSLAGLDAALAGGAERIELCSRLDVGGLSPTDELLQGARARVAGSVPLFVMVRPRAGDFVYSASELATMLAELATRRERADGFVFGALRPDGTVDRDATSTLVRAARPKPVTFHRAFDLVREPFAELETLIALGIERVLTSAGAPTAFDGRVKLAELVRRARGRIVILPGGGVRAAHAAELVRTTGVRELHGSVPFDARSL